MVGTIAFGIIVMPIIGSTIACIVIALMRELITFQGETSYAILWWGALIVGAPASLIGTFICVPLAKGHRGRPLRYVFICGLIGAVLGFSGFALFWGFLDFGPPSQNQNAIIAILSATAVITGFASGTIFGVAAYLGTQTAQRPTQ